VLPRQPDWTLWAAGGDPPYLQWYREAAISRPEPLPVPAPPDVVEAGKKDLPPPEPESSLPAGPLMAVFALTTLASLTGVWFVLRGPGGRSPCPAGGAGDAGEDGSLDDLVEVRLALRRLEEEVAKAEEACMDKEMYEARIEALERQLADRQGESARLGAELAAIRLKGMSEVASQVRELGALREQLREVEEQLRQAREQAARASALEKKTENLEAAVEERHTALEQMTAEKAALKLKGMAEAAAQVREMGELRERLKGLEEDVRRERDLRLAAENRAAQAGDAGRQDMLATREQLARLEEERTRLQMERAELDRRVRELEPERETAASLRAVVERLEREGAHDRARAEAVAVELEQVRAETALTSAREVEIARLKNEQASLAAEVEAMRAELTETRASSQEVIRLRTEIAALEGREAELLERNRQLVLLEDRVHAQADELARLRQENTSLRESQKPEEDPDVVDHLRSALEQEQRLRRKAEERAIQEKLMAGRVKEVETGVLKARIEQLKQRLAGPEKKAEEKAAPVGPAVIIQTPGIPRLPDDVMRRWIGKA